MPVMKGFTKTVACAFLAIVSAGGCHDHPRPGGGEQTAAANQGKKRMKMKVTIGAQIFEAFLEDNEAARRFESMLPLTLNMTDLHGNEKLHRFEKRFPTNDANPRSIRAGDLMIWNSDTVVLFYKDFTTPYSYTRLGSLSITPAFEKAVGSGGISVTFQKAK